MLARLCGVNPETVRRWRKWGSGGVRLEATEAASRKGVSLMFTQKTVREFLEANPKYLTPAMKESLGPDRPEETTPEIPEELSDNYAYRVLLKERDELMRRLADINALLMARKP